MERFLIQSEFFYLINVYGQWFFCLAEQEALLLLFARVTTLRHGTMANATNYCAYEVKQLRTICRVQSWATVTHCEKQRMQRIGHPVLGRNVMQCSRSTVIGGFCRYDLNTRALATHPWQRNRTNDLIARACARYYDKKGRCPWMDGLKKECEARLQLAWG